MAITKDMSILEVVQKYPDTAEVFMSAGMGCLGCAAAHFENIEQGALAHGIDVDALIQGLNDCVGAAELSSPPQREPSGSFFCVSVQRAKRKEGLPSGQPLLRNH